MHSNKDVYTEDQGERGLKQRYSKELGASQGKQDSHLPQRSASPAMGGPAIIGRAIMPRR